MDPHDAASIMDMSWQQTEAVLVKSFKEGCLQPDHLGHSKVRDGLLPDGSRVAYASAACDGWKDGNRENNEGVALQTIEMTETAWR
jgi:hypothetical protein